MEAEIKIGELNICVNCGELQVTYSIDSDGLPVCEDCDTDAEISRLEERNGRLNFAE